MKGFERSDVLVQARAIGTNPNATIHQVDSKLKSSGPHQYGEPCCLENHVHDWENSSHGRLDASVHCLSVRRRSRQLNTFLITPFHHCCLRGIPSGRDAPLPIAIAVKALDGDSSDTAVERIKCLQSSGDLRV
eukprot:CAMPEP_0202436684 /NCGR_PEP_ID=MMETSP1345-20130828/25818_1 /ASSEMBLY_ACC=CAM_ASM_000843 /TAXON_ID=342563 /ORGANISM="Fabrea Fabrea salina" /LENGTH=132 /DNA_ID=CAMNT_0049050169 /DNA_START=102 /DNA_END=500 /DNA_ORIENTATION=-